MIRCDSIENTHEMTEIGIDAIVQLYTAEGLSLRAIGRRVGQSGASIWKRLRRAGIRLQPRNTWVELICAKCGAAFLRPRSQAKQIRHYCSDACYQATIKQKGAGWVPSRVGQRKARKVVAAYFPLEPAHVVHHHDGDDTNNVVTNLAVFASQGEHMRFHRGGTARPMWDGRAYTKVGTISAVIRRRRKDE